ncbi:MAG: DegT/DnrJ/EryC1/StrS family aminotransferase [Clostridia bacterium]|nr:DegT/DnrJ/EryC1/StrS family aminotransferase [Clostridia bacterium]
MKSKVKMMTPAFNGDELQYVERALQKNEISITGENIDELTSLVLDYVKMPYGQLIANGTAGLHLALKAIGIDDNDLVFCPSMTYCGSAYPIIYERGIPVFIDSKKDGTMDENSLLAALEKYKDKLPKAVIIVDTYGAPADYDKLLPILKEYNVPAIEDSAESLGASFNGKKCGTLCDIGVFSFSYSKVVTTSLGGMVLSCNKDYMEKMSYLSNQAKAKSPYYIHKEVGYNYSMSNVLAGIGIPGMKNIENHLKRKQEIFDIYKKGFEDVPFISLTGDKDGSNHWQNGIIINNPDIDAAFVLNKLIENNIDARAGFNPMHRQEAFANFDFVSANNDTATELFRKTVLLPSGVGMTQKEQQYVIETVKKYI